MSPSLKKKKKVCKDCGNKRYIQAYGRCATCDKIFKAKQNKPSKNPKRNALKRRKRKIKRRSEGKISKLKREVWTWCSRYVRLLYSDDKGFCRCYTCNSKRFWTMDGMEGGHGIGGRNNAVLYMLEVLRPQCHTCNCVNNGEYEKFHAKLEKEHGKEQWEQIRTDAKKPKRFTEAELAKKLDFFKSEVERMKKEKGL